MSSEDIRKEMKQMNDKEHLERFMGALLIGKNSSEHKDRDGGIIAESLIPVMQKAIANLEKVTELTDKVSNLSENLAIERMSNKRMKLLFEDLAGVLHGRPELYPQPLSDLVKRIHKEVGLIK